MKQKREKWVARLRSTGQLDSDDLNEIVDHLDESIEALMSQGLSGDEAFMIATDRLGHPVAIGEEFDRLVSRAKKTRVLVYLILGGVGIPFLKELTLFLSNLFLYAGASFEVIHYEAFQSWTTIMASFFQLFIFGLAGWLLLSRQGSLGEKLARLRVTRKLLTVAFLIHLAGHSILPQIAVALRHLALRQISPSDHISHQPKSLTLAVDLSGVLLWLALIILIPMIVRMGEKREQTS